MKTFLKHLQYYGITIDDFPANNNNSASLKLKTEIAGRTGNDGKKLLKLEYH